MQVLARNAAAVLLSAAAAAGCGDQPNAPATRSSSLGPTQTQTTEGPAPKVYLDGPIKDRIFYPDDPFPPVPSRPTIRVRTTPATLNNIRVVRPPILIGNGDPAAGQNPVWVVYLRFNRTLPRDSYVSVNGVEPDDLFTAISKAPCYSQTITRFDKDSTLPVSVPFGATAQLTIHIKKRTMRLTGKRQHVLPADETRPYPRGVPTDYPDAPYARSLGCKPLEPTKSRDR